MSVALSTLAAVAGTAGAVTSGAGALYQGLSTSSMAAYQARVEQNNATIANQNANYAVQAGQAQAQTQSMEGAANVGAIKTSIAANNVDVNTGSAAKVVEGAREVNQLSTETTLNNAELQAYGYRAAATGYQAEAGLYQAEEGQAILGGELGGLGSLLSGASGVGFKWGQPTGWASPATPTVGNPLQLAGAVP